MNDTDTTLIPERRRKGLGLKLGLIGAGVAAGAIVATAMGASAATTTSGSGSTSSSSSSSTTTTHPAGPPAGAPGRGGPNAHGSAPVRSDEKAVDATLAAKLKAAALKAVPGGTVYRVETDSGDATYEAHMTKADGTEVTVKFDKNGAVTGVETGMGK